MSQFRRSVVVPFVGLNAGGAPVADLNATGIVLPAIDLLSPLDADWPVAANAALALDTNDPTITVRRFDDTVEEGVGLNPFLVPAGAVNVTLHFVSRAETAPAAARTVGVQVYERALPDNAAVTAWSAGTQLDDIAIPTNENFQYDSQTLALAALGLAAGQVHQLEITRVAPTAGTDLEGDWDLALLRLEFS